MTDVRLPERYLNDRRIQRLSNDEITVYIMSLLWAVSNQTDGIILTDDLPLIPRVSEGAVRALESAGLWLVTANGWVIADFLATQTTKAELDRAARARLAERDKKRRQREAKRYSPGAVPGDTTRDVPGDVSRDSTGQANTGYRGSVATPARRHDGNATDTGSATIIDSPVIATPRRASLDGVEGPKPAGASTSTASKRRASEEQFRYASDLLSLLGQEPANELTPSQAARIIRKLRSQIDALVADGDVDTLREMALADPGASEETRGYIWGKVHEAEVISNGPDAYLPEEYQSGNG